MIDKYLKDKTYVIVTHRTKLKELCNKHYVFENHIIKEIVNVWFSKMLKIFLKKNKKNDKIRHKQKEKMI